MRGTSLVINRLHCSALVRLQRSRIITVSQCRKLNSQKLHGFRSRRGAVACFLAGVV